MNKEIDFIITTYNSKDTLKDTLDSIVSQKNIPDYNIYIIDDCSDYDYEDILSDYNNIIYHKLDENKGPGNARNIGIDLANSKYLVFIDSDDIFYDDNSINYLYNSIKDKDIHLVTSNILEEKSGEYKSYKNELVGLHGKIYDRKYIVDNNIRFFDTRSNEDYAFNSLLKLNNSNILNIDNTTYIWKENKNSITRKNTTKQLNNDCLYFTRNSYEMIIESLKRNYEKEKIIRFCCEVVINIFYKICLVDDQNVIDEVINIYNDIMRIYNKISDVSLFDYANKNNMIYSKNKGMFLGFIMNNTFKEKKYTDYQRKQLGLFYHPLDDEFGDEKKKHIRLMNEFNKHSCFDYDDVEKFDLLKKMFGRYDRSSIVEPPVYSTWGCRNVYLGKNCFLNFNITFIDDGNIYIGNNVLISPGVHLITVNHPISFKLGRGSLIKVKDIHIEDNVWIGENSTILPGVTIGENSVIGAGSVVTKDIPPNVLAAGNPCKVIRKINSYDDIMF